MSICVTGIGIHGGQPATVTLHRVDGPTRFVRDGVTIPASYEYVSETMRATTLTKDGVDVHMVEHVLAALAIRGFYDGVLLEVSGAEVPILDGSAQEWFDIIPELGAPPSLPTPIVLSEQYKVSDGQSSITAGPGSGEWTVEIDFPHPSIGQQTWSGSSDSFEALINARTFGFLEELETLQANGLAHGASTENVLVFTHDGTVNEPRGNDEPVRHKALDFIGDLALLGRPVHGLGTVVRGSHSLHHKFVSQLAKTCLNSRTSTR